MSEVSLGETLATNEREEENSISIISIEGELEALTVARHAVQDKLDKMSTINSDNAADAATAQYITAVTEQTIDKLQHKLVVFGRIDEENHPWRIGLYGIDSEDSEQLVVDWRTSFAAGFYKAHFNDPMGLARRVSYVGCIDDLFVEEFSTGAVSGSSPLMFELSKSRSSTMQTAVATLQVEQDRLVRLPTKQKLVLRGGPGTGKTVVGLHRAAWLVYNSDQITADRILVIGPSDKFLTYVSEVLPTLGESRITETTFERLFGKADMICDDPRWIEVLDQFEESLIRPQPIKTSSTKTIPETEVIALVDRVKAREIPWPDRRRIFLELLAAKYKVELATMRKAAKGVWPSMTPKQAIARLSRTNTLESLGLESLGVGNSDVSVWAEAVKQNGGGVADEVLARFKGVPQRYSHVIVDEAQDMTLLQLRAVMRRSKGLTLVGDDAQKSCKYGIGLRHAAEILDVELEQLTTAYRMSAEIAGWLNEYAIRNKIDAVQLEGIRPTGVPVERAKDAEATESDLRSRWENVAVIDAANTWIHKGIEYDAVVVLLDGMNPKEVYLAASRAAHELVIID